MAQKKLPSFVTPKGTFKWPKLREPDFKFKDVGEFGVKLILDGEAAESLIRKLQPLHDKAAEDGKAEYEKLPVKTRKSNEFKVNPFFTPVYDEETEEETGDYEFNFKMTHSGVSKKTGKPWKRYPAIFDAKGQNVPKSVDPGNGTVGKVSFEVMPYFTTGVGAGLSLRLKGVQIIELVEYGQQTASGMGFGEEDGFDASEVEARDDNGQFEDGDSASGSDGDNPDF